MVNYFYQQKTFSFSAGIVLMFLITSFHSGVFTQSSNTPLKVSGIIASLVKQPLLEWTRDSLNISASLHPDTPLFYEDNDFQLVWLTPEHPLPQADSLINTLAFAYRDGLDTTTYYLPQIRQLKQETYSRYLKLYDFERLARLDVLLTDAYLQYARDLYECPFIPSKSDTTWIAKARVKKDFKIHLTKAVTSNQIKKSLEELIPSHENYKQLRNQLLVYQKIVSRGGWEKINPEKAVKLKQGDADSLIVVLKKHLLLTKDYWIEGKPDSLYDEKLTKALKRYQTRHNLDPNGKLDKYTIQLLNIPAEYFLKRIMLNMERFKWLPESYGDNYVLVNIPAFELGVYEKKTCKVMDMRVIVGQGKTATPIFSDTMEHLIFSPEWSVPLSIARKEMLPLLRHDPTLIEAQGIQVYKDWGIKAKTVSMYDINWEELRPDQFNYRLVARPGINNPLGFVMFQFPNPMHIYLHDTPFDGLFTVRRRDFSHGCIRIQYPGHLAKYILEADSSWTRNKIIEYAEKPKPVKINIPKKKIFVHLVYQTAYVDELGKLQFREDIYNHDVRHIKAIETARKRAKNQQLITKK
jgi:murein L,D-transpeptidase YcbB/YkuD